VVKPHIERKVYKNCDEKKPNQGNIAGRGKQAR